MEFGVARDLITPSVKTHMGGYGSLYGEVFEGIHDDLYVKAVLLDDGAGRMLLISVDLLMHDYALTAALGDYIQTRHGMPRDHLLVSYTHTHAGPAVEGYDPGQASAQYEALVLERMKSCIDRACANTFEGRIAFGTAEGEWSISRRGIVDGRMQNAPNLSGAKDRTMNILQITDQAGECRALLLNFGCHPVTLGPTLRISGEYPGRLCQLLETEFYGCTAVFFQGAGGSSRPLIAAKAGNTWKQCTFADVDGLGSAMARSVHHAVSAGKLQPFELDLAASQFVVALETEVYPREFFEAVVNKDGPNSPAKNEAKVVLDGYDTTPNVVSLHAAVVRLSGELYIAFLCGEVCYEVKQHVEKAFEGKTVIFIGYGDGSAYVPDDTMLAEGGYEADGSVVEFCLKGKFKPGIDRKMTDAFRAALETLDR